MNFDVRPPARQAEPSLISFADGRGFPVIPVLIDMSDCVIDRCYMLYLQKRTEARTASALRTGMLSVYIAVVR